MREFFAIIAAADCEIENGDYVCLEKRLEGFMLYEHLMTFCGVEIKRKVPRYACNATPKRESDEDC